MYTYIYIHIYIYTYIYIYIYIYIYVYVYMHKCIFNHTLAYALSGFATICASRRRLVSPGWRHWQVPTLPFWICMICHQRATTTSSAIASQLLGTSMRLVHATYMYIQTYTNVHIYTRIYVCTCTYTFFKHKSFYIHKHVYVYIHIYIHMHTHVHACMYVCMPRYIFISIHKNKYL